MLSGSRLVLLAVMLIGLSQTAVATDALGQPVVPVAQSSTTAEVTCESVSEKFGAVGKSPASTPSVQVTTSVDCARKVILITQSFRADQDLSAVGYGAFFTTVGFCSAPDVRKVLAAGWVVDLSLKRRGQKTVNAPLDCRSYDQMMSPNQPAPPGTPEALAEGRPAPAEIKNRPVLDFAVGELVSKTRARSTVKLPSKSTSWPFFTDDKVDLVIRHSDQNLRLANVGGTGHSVLLVGTDLGQEPKIGFVSFHYQDRPLKLAEAVSRAKELESWFLNAGFRSGGENGSGRPSFAVIKQEVDAARHEVKGWPAAEALLSDDAVNVAEMHLFGLSAPDAVVSVTIENWRRKAQMFGCKTGSKCHGDDPLAGRSIFDGNGGYEWGLAVVVHRPDELP